MIMSEHEVIVRGGLGNQIFCLFHAYKISIKYSTKVSLNLANYYLTKNKDRSFVLKELYPPLENEFKKKSRLLSIVFYILSRFYEKFLLKTHNNYLPGDNPFFINYWSNRYIHSGYFQKISESEIDKKCFDLIKRKIKPYISHEKFNYLAIHIRRGDYLNEKHSMHGIINQKYFFEEAKKQISESYYDGIKIFSDSPELIDIDMFRILHENIIIDEGGTPLDVFRRMANHKGLIASNSTFSLWAGILGDIKFFSIPYYWMKNEKSNVLGLKYINRYQCSF